MIVPNLINHFPKRHVLIHSFQIPLQYLPSLHPCFTYVTCLSLMIFTSKRKSSLKSKNVKQRKVGTIQNVGSDGGKHAKKEHPISRVNKMISFSVLRMGSERASCD